MSLLLLEERELPDLASCLTVTGQRGLQMNSVRLLCPNLKFLGEIRKFLHDAQEPGLHKCCLLHAGGEASHIHFRGGLFPQRQL